MFRINWVSWNVDNADFQIVYQNKHANSDEREYAEKAVTDVVKSDEELNKKMEEYKKNARKISKLSQKNKLILSEIKDRFKEEILPKFPEYQI